MADDESPTVHCNQFPTPPPFYKRFTQANVARLEEIRSGEHSSTTSGDIQDVEKNFKRDSIPEELRLLIPPDPPESGQYDSFGEAQNLSASLPSLSDWNAEQLYPSQSLSPDSVPDDRVQHFIRLVRSILLNFLELTNILSANPEQAVQKIEDLRVLFLNAHQLLNEYRPHQARESLVQMMEQRVNNLRQEIDSVDIMRSKVDELLASIGTLSDDQAGLSAETASILEQQKREQRLHQARRTRTALEAIELG